MRLAILFLAALLGGLGHAAVIAHWDFENDLLGVAADGIEVSHPSPNGDHDPAIEDLSGNGNHLSIWQNGPFGHTYRAFVDPDNATGSTLSVQNNGPLPGMFTDRDLRVGGVPVGSLNAFTIEASVYFDALGGFQTIVGKDGVNVGADPLQALLYLQKTNANAFAISFNDGLGNNAAALTAPSFVAINTWYQLAAVIDGTTVSLYVDGVLEAQTPSTIDLGALDLFGASGPDPYAWTVGRGMYNNGHTDRLTGYLDDVRISDTALSPSQFLGAASTIPEPGTIALTLILMACGISAARSRQPVN